MGVSEWDSKPDQEAWLRGEGSAVMWADIARAALRRPPALTSIPLQATIAQCRRLLMRPSYLFRANASRRAARRRQLSPPDTFVDSKGRPL